MADVVPGPLGGEVGEQLGGVELAHPVVGVRPHHAVLGVLERLARRRRGPRVVTGGTVLPRRQRRARRVATARWRWARPSAPRSTRRPVRRTTSRSPSPSRSSTRSTRSTRSSASRPTSYEMWALTYDYLISYSMEDMSPEPGARRVVGDLRGRPDLDLHIRDGVDVVRRRAADRRRHRLHLQPDHRRRPRGGTWGVVPDLGRDGRRLPTTRPSC